MCRSVRLLREEDRLRRPYSSTQYFPVSRRLHSRHRVTSLSDTGQVTLPESPAGLNKSLFSQSPFPPHTSPTEQKQSWNKSSLDSRWGDMPWQSSELTVGSLQLLSETALRQDTGRQATAQTLQSHDCLQPAKEQQWFLPEGFLPWFLEVLSPDSLLERSNTQAEHTGDWHT